MRAWFEFNWLGVETGGHLFGLMMKSHCVKTWWNLIGVSDWGSGGGGGACRCFLCGDPCVRFHIP